MNCNNYRCINFNKAFESELDGEDNQNENRPDGCCDAGHECNELGG